MRKALGRGLDALIPSAPQIQKIAEGGRPLSVPIEKVRPNHLQPRKFFDAERLSELASSIKKHGLAQPLLVSYDKVSDTYEIIAGERRLRAAELAGLREVPVIVREPESDLQRLELALIENLQREDLNAIEAALGYLRLMKEFRVSQTELGAVVGKSKAAISNTLRLLELPEDIQKAVEFGQITEGHARALLMVQDPVLRKQIFNAILEQRLSVRQTEDLARQAPPSDGAQARRPGRPRRVKPADIRDLEESLSQSLGTKVEIKVKKDPTKGSLIVHFFSLDELDKIVKLLKK